MTDTKSIVLKGKAYWAHVRTPEKWDGEETGYSIMVQLESEEKLEKLKKYLSDFWDEHKSELDGKKLKAKADFLSPFKELDDGTVCVKARTLHYYKNRKTGEITPKTLPVFKADGTPLEEGVLVGNGSKVQVNVTPAISYANSSKYGVKLYLNAVVVNELVEYHSAKSANEYGFDLTEKSSEVDPEEVEF